MIFELIWKKIFGSDKPPEKKDGKDPGSEKNTCQSDALCKTPGDCPRSINSEWDNPWRQI